MAQSAIQVFKPSDFNSPTPPTQPSEKTVAHATLGLHEASDTVPSASAAVTEFRAWRVQLPN